MKINRCVNFPYIAFKIIFVSNFIFYILSECPKNLPIMKNESVSTYCSEDQFE